METTIFAQRAILSIQLHAPSPGRTKNLFARPS